MRQIARELGHTRKTIKKALAQAEPPGYDLTVIRTAPLLGPFKVRINEFLAQNEQLPPKQRYTGKRIYEEIQQAGYQGNLSSIQVYVWTQPCQTAGWPSCRGSNISLCTPHLISFCLRCSRS
jgi:hypothetical protein